MADTAKKPEGKDVKTGWVVLEFTSAHGTKKSGDKETYHMSTAKGLIARKVAKIVEELTKFVPKQVQK